MPTARRRYQVTETEEVEHALDEAAKRWPNEPRSRLMLRVINAGRDTVARQSKTETRLVAIRRVAGSYLDAYGADHLRRLRDDWLE